MSYQLVDEFRIAGLQNYDLDEKLNPIENNIRHSEIQGKLSRYGTQRYEGQFPACWFFSFLLIFTHVRIFQLICI